MTNLVIFRGRLRTLLSVFIIKLFTYNYYVNVLIRNFLDFFNGMLLHSSFAMETCFGQLGSYLENRYS